MEDGWSNPPPLINTQPRFSLEHDRLSKLVRIINFVDMKRVISTGSVPLD